MSSFATAAIVLEILILHCSIFSWAVQAPSRHHGGRVAVGSGMAMDIAEVVGKVAKQSDDSKLRFTTHATIAVPMPSNFGTHPERKVDTVANAKLSKNLTVAVKDMKSALGSKLQAKLVDPDAAAAVVLNVAPDIAAVANMAEVVSLNASRDEANGNSSMAHAIYIRLPSFGWIGKLTRAHCNSQMLMYAPEIWSPILSVLTVFCFACIVVATYVVHATLHRRTRGWSLKHSKKDTSDVGQILEESWQNVRGSGLCCSFPY